MSRPSEAVAESHIRRHSMPLMRLGERTVDLSNLCPRGVSRPALPPRSRYKMALGKSLYPDSSSVEQVQTETALEAFNRASLSGSSGSLSSTASNSSRQQQGQSNYYDSPRLQEHTPINVRNGRYGTFQANALQRQYTATAANVQKVPAPTWVKHDRAASSLERKLAAKHPPSPGSDVDSEASPTSVVDGTSREIEVTPGFYMKLRGAAETMAAVKNKYATHVSCFACGIRLQCVPDAKLVICPDCLTLSPLPEDDPCLWSQSLPAIPNMWLGQDADDDYEDDEDTMDPSPFYRGNHRNNIMSHTGNAARHHKQRRWGVGLGLKCEYPENHSNCSSHAA